MTAIVILGMHRSGTSAITRALNLLGAEIGPQADLGQYWESQRMRGPLDAVLAAFDGHWDAPGVMPDGWEQTPAVRAVEPSAREGLAAYGDPDVMVWKDPRLCLEMPFWRPLLGGDPVVVLIHRHPEEVWQSLATRNRLGAGLSFALWERYNADALRDAAGLRTVVVSYSDLVERPVEVTADLVATLATWGVHLPNDPATTDMELRADERHHRAATAFEHPSATPSQRALFTALASIEGVHDAFVPPDLAAPDPLSTELIAARAEFRAMRRERWLVEHRGLRILRSRKRVLDYLLRPYHEGDTRPDPFGPPPGRGPERQEPDLT
ncbi:MAG: sulfotransferase family protein [Actinomycetes bacterium]